LSQTFSIKRQLVNQEAVRKLLQKPNRFINKVFAAPIFNQTATEEIKDGRKISKKTEKMANKDIATNIFDLTATQESIGC
jgi:hypothetical protein